MRREPTPTGLAPHSSDLCPSTGPTPSPSSSPFPFRSRKTTARRGSAGRRRAQDRPEKKTPGAGAAPSPSSILHDGDLLLREAVQLVNQGVDLLIGRLYLLRKEGLLVAGLRLGKPPDKSQHMIGGGHHRRVAGETVEDISCR